MAFALSSPQPAMQTLKTTRFQVLTGCNPLAMTQLQNPYNGAQLQTVGASSHLSFGRSCVMYRDTW